MIFTSITLKSMQHDIKWSVSLIQIMAYHHFTYNIYLLYSHNTKSSQSNYRKVFDNSILWWVKTWKFFISTLIVWPIPVKLPFTNYRTLHTLYIMGQLGWNDLKQASQQENYKRVRGRELKEKEWRGDKKRGKEQRSRAEAHQIFSDMKWCNPCLLLCLIWRR